MSASTPDSSPAAASAASPVLATVRISGQPDSYPPVKWREAIAAFTDFLWSGDESLGSQPSISFGNVVLFRASPEKGYRAYRTAATPWPVRRETDAWQSKTVSFLEAEVQNGLACLIFNDRLASLVIQLPPYGGRQSFIVFTKGEDPNDVDIEGVNLPPGMATAESLA